MTAATITQAKINPPQTLNGTINALATAFTSAGFDNLIDSWTASNGDVHRTFQLTGNANATKGSIVFDFWLTNNTSAQRTLNSAIYDTWNTSAHTGTNGSINYSFSTPLSFTNGQIITLTSFNHPELKVVSVQQSGGPTLAYFGIMRPQSMPPWWDENLYPYFLMVNNVGSKALTTFFPLNSNLNPYYNSNTFSYITDTSMGYVNPITGKADVLSGLIITALAANAGLAGRTSGDLVQASALGRAFLDVIQVTPGVEEYTLLTAGGAPGLAIRTI